MIGPTRWLALALTLLSTSCRDDEGDPLSGRGTIEHVETEVAALATARVVAVHRREGDFVAAGDTLVSLTQTTEQTEIEGRRSRLAAAEAHLRDLMLGARPAEIERMAAELRSAEAEASRTAIDARRADSLLVGGNISAQQQEAARAAAATAAARRDAAREALRLTREGARPQQVAAARAEVETARTALQAAERAASELVLLAPVSGLITSRNVEPGEVVPAGVSTMTIADVHRPYVRVFLRPRGIPMIAPGDTALATLDDFPGRRFNGRVVAVSPRAEFTPRVALTDQERSDLLFGVRVDFADSTGVLRAGLPVAVRIFGSGMAPP
jgi:HlyD family secretion protein